MSLEVIAKKDKTNLRAIITAFIRCDRKFEVPIHTCNFNSQGKISHGFYSLLNMLKKYTIYLTCYMKK